jgi:hypothetical protein
VTSTAPKRLSDTLALTVHLPEVTCRHRREANDAAREKPMIIDKLIEYLLTDRLQVPTRNFRAKIDDCSFPERRGQ